MEKNLAVLSTGLSKWVKTSMCCIQAEINGKKKHPCVILRLK
jgi:hypothetical protein